MDYEHNDILLQFCSDLCLDKNNIFSMGNQYTKFSNYQSRGHDQ